MHLWPSERIRDSFKIDYLRRLEWNLHRMNSDKQSPSNRQRLLDDKEANVDKKAAETPISKKPSGADLYFREILMVLSCCYCCFCCGDRENSTDLKSNY